MRFGLIAIPLVFSMAPAFAEDRDYCPARPGLGTPACTISPGRVSLETGLIDWTREEDSDQRSDTTLFGDTLVRIGLTDSVEAQIGWTPYGHARTRDRIAGTDESTDRIGDALLGFKVNLHNPDGSGFSIAVQPFVTLPVGKAPIGAGDWGAGVVVPMSVDLSDTLSLQFSPEADAAVDQDGEGRHFAASGTIGLGIAISDAVGGTIEFQALRDEDPSGSTTQSLASVSLGWMPSQDLQLDIGVAAGLNRDAPDVELYVGVSHQF
jgi:hypothetical protein